MVAAGAVAVVVRLEPFAWLALDPLGLGKKLAPPLADADLLAQASAP